MTREEIVMEAMREALKNGVAYIAEQVGSLRTINAVRRDIQRKYQGQVNGDFIVRAIPHLGKTLICTRDAGFYIAGANRKLVVGRPPVSDKIAAEIIHAALRLRREGEDWEEDALTINCVNKNLPAGTRRVGSLFTICFNATPMGDFHRLVVYSSKVEYIGLIRKTYEIKPDGLWKAFCIAFDARKL